jgi:hypothetical protein
MKKSTLVIVGSNNQYIVDLGKIPKLVARFRLKGVGIKGTFDLTPDGEKKWNGFIYPYFRLSQVQSENGAEKEETFAMAIELRN